MNTEVSLRMATQADTGLPTFDFTKLAAVNSCPRYGIIRYTHHKVLTAEGYRAMALEAGTVMHECFSAIRLWQLGMMQGHHGLMHLHGVRLFGDDRWQAICQSMDGNEAADQLRACALEALSTSGFTDDDNDRRRTYSNLETSLLYYVQRWDHTRYPVWVRDVTDSSSDIGIEIPFDIVVSDADHSPLFRYTGRIDGIHTDTRGDLIIQENKTASRLNTAWRMAFNTSHQVTGYCVAASLFTQHLVERGMVLGIAIPLPRAMSDGLVMEPVSRPLFAKQQWLEWMLHTVRQHDTWRDNPLQAPMYTHSCNRYFTPCSYIPLCAGDPDEQALIMQEMRTEEWSPLNDTP